MSSAPSGTPRWVIFPVAIAIVAMVALPFTAVKGHTSATIPEDTVPTTRVLADAPVTLDAEPLTSQIEDLGPDQVTYYNFRTGDLQGTASDRFARPALSLAKLYIAQYVFEHGTAAEQRDAVTMLQDSDDAIATELYEAYPESIDSIAEEFQLESTYAAPRWGYSRTSTYDVVRFITALLLDDPNTPLITALRGADAVAADGTEQDFGTYVLPGVKGTKWGWSDEGSLHSSVSFGKDFVVAAAVYGSADELTDLVERTVLASVGVQRTQAANGTKNSSARY